MAGKKGYRLRTIAYTKTFKKDYQRMAARRSRCCRRSGAITP